MQTEQITYAALERLLSKLGYHQVPSPPEARVFAFPAYDAVSVLPCADESEWARPHHLVTLRRVAVEKGIVDSKTFDEMLNDVRHEAADAMAKAS
jgi:hypothetical protein